MKPYSVATAFLVFGLSTALHGAELQPLITTSGKALVSEDFSGKEIPKTIRVLEGPATVENGVLQIESQAGQDRSTYGVIAVPAHDLTISFSVKFTKPGSLYIGVDGYKEEFKGNTHLVRFGLTPDHMVWDQHRGGPESKKAVGEANKAARAAKQPIPQPTKEQLADPHFFRIEELSSKAVRCSVDEWHQVMLEVSGNELVAQMDGAKLFATSTEADSQKNRIGVGLTGRGIALIRNLRITENSRRADWQQVKATSAAEGNAKQ